MIIVHSRHLPIYEPALQTKYFNTINDQNTISRQWHLLTTVLCSLLQSVSYVASPRLEWFVSINEHATSKNRISVWHVRTLIWIHLYIYPTRCTGNYNFANRKCLSAECTRIIIIIITETMFMVLSSWQSHCESSRGSFDEYRMAPSSRRPKTKPDDLGSCDCESACTGCQKLHRPKQ